MFDKNEIVIPAGQEITLRFVNQDLGIEHNFSVYKSEVDDAIVSITYCRADCVRFVTLNLDPGEYRFQCDIHPSMFGRLTAT